MLADEICWETLQRRLKWLCGDQIHVRYQMIKRTWVMTPA